MSKQDCEIEAAKCLLKRLSKDYPKLPVYIQGDNLYEAEPLMKICRGKKWKYLFIHKGTRQKLLEESYEWIREGKRSTQVRRIGKENYTRGMWITRLNFNVFVFYMHKYKSGLRSD